MENLNLKCPRCSNDLMAQGTKYICSGLSKNHCDFQLPFFVAGVKLTNEDYQKLLSGEITDKKAFNKFGIEFEAKLKMYEELIAFYHN